MKSLGGGRQACSNFLRLIASAVVFGAVVAADAQGPPPADTKCVTLDGDAPCNSEPPAPPAPLPIPKFDDCGEHLLNEIFNQCGNSANPDPSKWYSITNHCDTKAHDIFNICETQGFDARYLSLSCKGQPLRHSVTECKIEGKWYTFNVASVEDVGGPFDGPKVSDEEACRLMGKAPEWPSDKALSEPVCGCKRKAPGKPAECPCQAKVFKKPPEEGPISDPQYCAEEVKEKKKGKGTRGDCLQCCDEFKDVEVDQKELREFSCNNFKLECADNLQTGQPSEMLYWGLIAMWRCDQWPKQAEKKFKECQKACGRSFPRPMRRR
jgi:hypothetical protein